MFPNDWNEDHGDRLFSEARATEVRRPHVAVIVGLLLLCLVPRVWAGTLHDILCPDAVSYVRWTNALQVGDVRSAFGYTGVNVYQPLLLGLKSLPGDWLVAAKWWSVAMATLAILPIYGWIRRQFNETLAVIGCGFYALHPAMIHDSPLIIRDPTFWLLFALGLYTAWRAVSELQYRWFACFAVVFGLAIHLRTEGWLLAPVLIAWIAFRLRPARGRRFGIVTATLLAVTAGPIVGKLTHAVVLPRAEKQIQGDRRHLGKMEKLANSVEADPSAAIVDGTARVAVRYVKAFGYLQLILAAIGLAHWKLRMLGPSKGALVLFCLLSTGAIWACFCLIEMDRRYAFPSVIASLPTIAVGLCVAATWCAHLANHLRQFHRRDFSFWLLCLTLASSVLLSVTIVTNPRPLQYDQAEIGRWIRMNIGPDQRIAVNLRKMRLVEHYAAGKIALWLPLGGPSDPEQDWLAQCKPPPSVILIWLDWRNPAGRAAFEPGIWRAKGLGYREVPAEELPKPCRQILVLMRERLR